MVGTSLAISDGSFKDKFGTSAFTILSEFDTSTIGLNIMSGHSDDQSTCLSKQASPAI
jgi:hypothetical protein